MFSSSAGFAQATLTKTGWNLIFHEDFKNTTYYATNPQAMPHLNNNFSGRMTFGAFQEGIQMRDTNIILSSHMDNYGPNADVTLKSHVNPAVYNVMHYNGQGVAVSEPCFYNSGWLRTTFEDRVNSGGVPDPNVFGRGGYLYGMFEVRCKLPRHKGSTPAVWLTGNNASPPEIDFIENASSYKENYDERLSAFFSTVHWNEAGQPNGHAGCANYFQFPNTVADWHTWTVVWTPYEITWFLDGVELKTDRDPKHIPGHYAGENGAPYNLGDLLTWRVLDLICSNSTNGR